MFPTPVVLFPVPDLNKRCANTIVDHSYVWTWCGQEYDHNCWAAEAAWGPADWARTCRESEPSYCRTFEAHFRKGHGCLGCEGSRSNTSCPRSCPWQEIFVWATEEPWPHTFTFCMNRFIFELRMMAQFSQCFLASCAVHQGRDRTTQRTSWTGSASWSSPRRRIPMELATTLRRSLASFQSGRRRREFPGCYLSFWLCVDIIMVLTWHNLAISLWPIIPTLFQFYMHAPLQARLC